MTVCIILEFSTVLNRARYHPSYDPQNDQEEVQHEVRALGQCRILLKTVFLQYTLKISPRN